MPRIDLSQRQRQGLVWLGVDGVSDSPERATSSRPGLIPAAEVGASAIASSDLLAARREFKLAFDPRWKMNPGKVIDAFRLDQDLELGVDYDPARPEARGRAVGCRAAPVRCPERSRWVVRHQDGPRSRLPRARTMTTSTLAPRVGIGYNLPLALAMRIADDAAGRCRPVWIVDSTGDDLALTTRMLERLGEVVDLAGLDHRAGIDALRARHLDALVTYMDDQILFLAEAAEELALPFETPSVAACLSDKLTQRERLRSGGVATPPFAGIELGANHASLQKAIEVVGFPAILKPRRANASRQVSRVNDEAELQQALRRIEADEFPAAAFGLLLEGFLPDASPAGARFDDLVSVETVVQNGIPLHLAVSGRRLLTPPFRECGLFAPAALEREQTEAARRLASDVVSALGIQKSVLHIELKFTPDGPRVVEVNGRAGGTVPEVLELAGAGFSLTAAALEIALGQSADLPVEVSLPRVGYHMVWQPPIEARVVRSIHGLDAVRSLPGVAEVQLNRGAGKTVDWQKGFEDFIFSVAGSAGDHQEMIEVVDRIDEAVTIDYER